VVSKSSIKRFFFQLFTIAAGVYLGVVAGNWNDSRKLKKAKTEFLDNITKELQTNINKLEWAIIQHEKLEVSVDSLFAVKDEAFLEEKFFDHNGFQMLKSWRGFGIPNLSDNVFKTGLNTNIFSELDFETSSLLSGIYSGPDGYSEFTDPVMKRALFDFSYDTKNKEVFFLFDLIKNDVLGSEKRLVMRLKESIEKLEKIKK